MENIVCQESFWPAAKLAQVAVKSLSSNKWTCYEENGQNEDVVTAPRLRRQQSHISFIGFQIWPRRRRRRSDFPCRAHGSGAEGKVTLVITDEGGRGMSRCPPPLLLLCCPSLRLQLSVSSSFYLQLPHSILHHFRAFGSFHLCVSQELRTQRERERAISGNRTSAL